MTPEEQKRVQDILNSRTRLLNQRIAQQEEQILSMSALIDSKEQELSGLKTQLEESQRLNATLQAEIQKLKARPEASPVILSAQVQKPETPQPQKPSYLVSLLRQHFTLESFLPGQEEAVDAILAGRDIFCSMPEDSGISICYRLSALLMPGITLVITKSEQDYPESDSHSEALSSSMTPAKKRELFRNIKIGIIKLLFSSFELLNQDDTAGLLSKCDISFAAITDIHRLKNCSAFLDSLSRKRIARGVFTHATSPTERQESYKYLRSPVRIVAGFSRPDVAVRIIRTDNRIAALQDVLAQKTDMHGVVYCSTPEAVWRLREILRDYPNLDDNVEILPSRLHHQVARKDIRFVIHYDLPENLADYSRQTACAGIDGSKAECVMLVSRKDLLTADKSIVKFCSSKKPKDYMLEYLGEDEKFSAQPEQPKPQELEADDVSDFDFGTANEAQKEAITSTNGPMLIIAGPGTGKTYTLVQRAVFLIQKKHVNPASIMLATFTDKAAQELITRISEALSSRNILADTGSMYAGTFHVICSRILREYSEFTGLGKTFRILDEFGHAYTIMQNFKLFENIRGIKGVFRFPGKWRRSCELRDYISKLSEELTDPEELISDPDSAISALGRAMQVHTKLLKSKNCMSYSSLLTETYKLLRNNPEILENLQHKIQYIMIDEYQDTNYVQEQLAFLLGAESRNICVVGDDDQSLYRFRGATVRNILEFPDKWNKSECKIVRLMLNYRSSPAIVNFASQWMDSTGEFFSWDNFRYAKKLEAFRPAAKYPSVMRLAGIGDKEAWHEKILSFINSLRDSGVLKDYSQIAFLFRSVRAKGVQELAHFLEGNNINVYSPRSNLFFSRMEIRFAIGCMISMFPDYMKAINSGKFDNNTITDYYKGCLQIVARFIDKPNLSELKRHLLTVRNYHGKLTSGYTNYVYTDLLYELFGFEPFAHSLSVHIDSSVKDLRPVRNISRLVKVFRDYELSYNVNNISAGYLRNQFEMMMNIYMKFRIDEGLDEYESDYESIPAGHVAFMTIHQAKGREFPVVFVDSLWAQPDPELRQDWNNELITRVTENHSRRPEFEPHKSIKLFDFWRMYYVAFTRAQNMLVLTCNEDGKTPSKFLEPAYDRLDDSDDVLTPSAVELDAPKDSGLRKTYSFTSHILTYEKCPMQYKFFRELDFPMGLSETTFLGKLVHTTIEDIHRAALNHEEHRITEPNIAEWFAANYEKLSRTELGYLSEASKKTAFSQVMHYVHLQGNDWSGITMAEAEVNLVRDEYILEGKIDLVRMRDGETEIIDFKSGTKPNMNISSDRERLEECRRQVNVYAYLAVHALGLKVARMKLYYTGEEGTAPEIVYPYDEGKAEEVVKGFDDVVSKIQNIDFEHRSDDMEECGECAFRYWCRLENPAIPLNLPKRTAHDDRPEMIPQDLLAMADLYESGVD